jgi:hypothetical protein
MNNNELRKKQFYKLLEETGDLVCVYCGHIIREFGCCGEVHYEPLYTHPWILDDISESEIEDTLKTLLPIGEGNSLYETKQ